MTRETRLARLLRALSGKTQEQMADALGVHPSLITQFELDQGTPSPEHLEGMAREAGLTVPEAEELLDHYGTLQRAGRWRGEGLGETIRRVEESLRVHLAKTCEQLLAVPGRIAGEESEERAAELWARLEKYPVATQLELLEVADEYRNRTLHGKLREMARQEAAGNAERAAGLERVAGRIAELAGFPADPGRLGAGGVI